MLIRFFKIDFNSEQSVSTILSLFGNNVPEPLCMSFSNVSSKYVFCVDASIDTEKIFTDNGIYPIFIHDLDVTIETFNNSFFIGTDVVGSDVYKLIEIVKPLELPVPEN
jgi:hypothetical protein